MNARDWLALGVVAATAACGSGVAATMEGGPGDGALEVGARDTSVPRDGGHDARAHDAQASDADAQDGQPQDAPGLDAPTTDAETDAPPADSGSGCTPPAALPGEPCDGGTICGKSLTCDLSGSWFGGLGPDASTQCREHAGTCCGSASDCLSGICAKGTCARSPLDYSCGSAADCIQDAAPYGDAGVYCYEFLYGRCCPVGSPPHGAPPGCPGA